MRNKKILLFGSKGQLGKEFINYFETNNFEFFAFDIDEYDISDYNSLLPLFENKPDLVINCAAYNLVDKAETDFETANSVNSAGPANLARLCQMNSSFLIHFSSDYVFDGNSSIAYTESDQTNPINNYGKTKLNGELEIDKIFNNYLIFRLSWVFGNGNQNFIYKFIEWSKSNSKLKISDDEISIPTYTKFIVEKSMKSYQIGLQGLYHLTPSAYCSRFDWANEIKTILALNVEIEKAKKDDFNLPAKRPEFSVMSNKMLSDALQEEFLTWNYYLNSFLKENK